MKCISCEVEINPKWKHALELNICPFCGQDIMDNQLKTLLSSLRETMEKLSEYPVQLNDWMLSNHNYIKTDSEDLPNYLSKDLLKELYKENDERDFLERKNKKFTVKVTSENGEEQDVIAQKIQSEEKTNEFYRRAEAVKPNIEGFKTVSEKTQKLKEMAQKIRKEGSNPSESSESFSEVIDPSIVEEMQSLMIDDGIVNSAIADPDFDEERIPSVVLNMAKKVRTNKDPNDDLRKLQELQAKAQRNSLSGRGGFSRS